MTSEDIKHQLIIIILTLFHCRQLMKYETFNVNIHCLCVCVCVCV